MVVSGFVITHLLLTRQERYVPYITKRFFRLFPALVVCATAGAAAVAISRTPWPGDPTYQYGLQLLALQEAQSSHLGAHVLLHLTMLHGVIPNSVLNVSQWALLPPAWSASLEWQFYLVAPAAVLLFRRKAGAILLTLLAGAGLWSYASGRLGTFDSPSILPAAAEFFLVGIASRSLWGEIKPRAPAIVAVTILAIAYVTEEMAIGLWLAFLTYLLEASTPTKEVDRRFVTIGDTLFASRFAQWAGKRTYSVYLVHFPVLQLLLSGVARAGVKSPSEAAALLLALGLPATAVAAEMVHRYVELPGIALGKELALRVTYRASAVVRAAV
jgi:peptidoglycan/LPS O-acetylase OafA/YrhL